MIIRQMKKKDYEPYKRLFEEAYSEYLEFLKSNNPLQYQEEAREKSEVTRPSFNYCLRTGSSFVAEEESEVIGYVASQSSISFVPDVDKLLWIEYIVVKSGHRRRGVGTALLQKLIDHAKQNNMIRIYSTINPDNKASIKLHQKAGFNVKGWKVASFKSTS